MTEPRLERDSERAPGPGPRGVPASIRRGAVFAVAIAAVAAVGTYLGVRAEPPLFRATAVLIAPDTLATGAPAGVRVPAPVDPSVYRAALVHGGVAREALSELWGGPPSDAQLTTFLRSVRVDARRQDASSLVRLSVTDTDPLDAQASARVLAADLVTWDRDRIRRATRRSAAAVGLLQPVTGALPTVERVHPRTAFKTLAAALIGAAAGLGVGLVRTSLEPRLLDRADLAATTRLPVLAESFGGLRLRANRDPGAPSLLLATLLKQTRHRPAFTVAITSPRHAAEKRGMAASLAADLARAGRTTLLVDADLRRASDAYGLDPSTVSATPLEVRLQHPERSYAPARVAVGADGSYDFIPSFTSATDPAALLGRPLAQLLGAFDQAYDVVLVDCPPVLPNADTLAVAPWCDALVLCAARHATRRDELREALERLREVHVRPLGAVLTRSRAGRPRPVGRGRRRSDDASPDPYVSLVDEAGPEVPAASRHARRRPRQRS